MGDSLLQKTYTADFLTRKQVKNNGEVTQYYVKESHVGIIPREEWNAVQQEFKRIEEFLAEHHLTKYGYGGEVRPFSMKIICGNCGNIYGRKHRIGKNTYAFWQCNTRCNKGLKECHNENVRENVIHMAFIQAWNAVVENQSVLNERWDRLEREGTELKAYRAKQMRALAKQGMLKEIVPELVQTVLESITVKGNNAFEVRFMEGTSFQVQI